MGQMDDLLNYGNGRSSPYRGGGNQGLCQWGPFMNTNLLSLTLDVWLEYQAAKQKAPLSHDVRQLKAQLDNLILNLSDVVDGEKVRAARNAD